MRTGVKRGEDFQPDHHETGRMAQDSGVFKEEQNYLHPALCRCRKGSIIPLPLRAAGTAFENREVREFLRSCGYESFEVASVLVRLRRRYQLYAGISKEFPHELGVLLGYPVGDVQGFIDNRGENSLTSRYWKVYQNPKEAEKIFDLYDRVKEQALKEIMCGRTLSHVAVS